MDNNFQPAPPPEPSELNVPEISTPKDPSGAPAKKPMNRNLVILLRVLVIGGGLFIFIVIGLGISFSACFTIKGPPPPECAPVSFVSLLLMPAASLLFWIPLARRIK